MKLDYAIVQSMILRVQHTKRLARVLRVAVGIAAVIAVSSAFAIFFSKLDPFSMDEVLVHHAFACARAPLNFRNTFREPCGAYLLNMPIFGSLPLRSYSYVGAVQSLFYAPVYWLWSHPESSRAFGIATLGFQAWCIHRLFGISWPGISLVLLCWFPYSFQHLVDTGQVSLQFSALFGMALCARAWTSHLRLANGSERDDALAVVPAALAGSLLSLGLFLRLSFLFLVPGALLVLGMYVGSTIVCRHISLRRALPGIFAFLLFAILPSLFLLSAESLSGRRYIDIALDHRLGGGLIASETFSTHLLELLEYVVDPLASAHVLFAIPDLDAHRLGFHVLPLALIAVTFWSMRGRRQQSLALISYAAGALTLLFVSLSHKSWAMHHVVLAYPFIVLAVAIQWASMRHDKRRFRGVPALLFVAFGLYGLSLYGRLWSLHPIDRRMIGVVDTTEFVRRNFASDHVIVAASWGIYYVQALYGPPSQAVLFTTPPKRSALGISKIARELKRRLVILTYGNRRGVIEPIARFHPGLPESGVRVAEGNWYIWAERKDSPKETYKASSLSKTATAP